MEGDEGRSGDEHIVSKAKVLRQPAVLHGKVVHENLRANLRTFPRVEFNAMMVSIRLYIVIYIKLYKFLQPIIHSLPVDEEPLS